nr:retrovirus-related Pol polyprotein from transposon TNT 1-94 [Tanacetum cinerariifolium]
MINRHSKEAEMKRMTKVIGNVLDAMIQIISLENVQNQRKTRTKEHSLEALGVIAVRKMMKRLKTKHVSWLKHLVRDKSGLGFNSFEASSSRTKEIKFVKPEDNSSSGGDPQSSVGGPHKAQMPPKAIEGLPVCSPDVEKSVSFQKYILGPRPKHIMVNNVKISVAIDKDVKQFYKPSLKPKVRFPKPNFKSKTPPPRRVNNSYPRSKTPQPRRNVVRQNQPHGYPYLTMFGPKSYEGVFLRYSQNSKAYIILNKHTMKIKDLLNVTFDETPPPYRTSPLVDDDLDEEEAIKVTEKKNLENDIENETLEIDEELVPQPKNMKIIGTKWGYRNKLDENGVVYRNKDRLVAQGYNQHESIDYDETYAPVSRPDIMFSVFLCARFQKDPKTSHLEAVKRIFRYINGTTHLGLWYPKRTGIETVLYADSDHARDYMDRKITGDICTFVGCCLTSWFSKKHTALAISNTEAKYPSNPFFDDIMDAPPRPLNPLPLQSHPSLDITLSLSPITHLDHFLDTISPPSPQPPSQPPLMGHSIWFRMFDYNG